MPDLIVHGGVITLSIRVDDKTNDEFMKLEKLIVAKKKITAKDASAIAQIIQKGYVTQCGYEAGDEYSKIQMTEFELVASAVPRRPIE